MLDGPHGLVRVANVVKHLAVERDLVRVHIAPEENVLKTTMKNDSFTITANHKIYMCERNGTCSALPAKHLVSELHAGLKPCVRTGAGLRNVVLASLFVQSTEVVEVMFEDENAVVFAWEFSSRTPRTVRENAAVCCAGRDHHSADRLKRTGLVPKNTFIDGSPKEGRRRSSSEGDKPRPDSSWSVGTISHDESDERRCAGRVCRFHRRYMQTCATHSGAKPCKDGAACKFCHDKWR